jgi:zinc/manganese transport system substrate-binding protein
MMIATSRVYLFALALAAAVGISAHPREAQAAVNVFSCEPEWGTLAREIGGDRVSVFTATTGRQDPHFIQARPGLIARVHRADLVFCTGVELELGWLPLLIINASNPAVQPGTSGYLLAGEFVRLLDVNPRADRSQGDVHAAGNHHVIADPRNLIPIAKALKERLALIDPADAGYFDGRLEDFLHRWNEALRDWETRAAPLKGIPVVVHHKTWSYLFDWLGMKELASLEPKPGIPPSSAHLNTVMAILKVSPARMILHAAFEDPQPSKYMAQKTGLPSVALPYTVGGTDDAKDLFSLFDVTIDRLLAGLRGQDVAGN